MRGGPFMWAVLALLLVLLGASSVLADAPATGTAWDMESFVRIVGPMQHSISGRMPIMVWNLPLPLDDELVPMQRDGRLGRYIAQLAERGIVPTVNLGWQWSITGALTMARALQEGGRPVNILFPEPHLLEAHIYKSSTVGIVAPTALSGGLVRRWPCFPEADAREAAELLRQQLQPFKDAGIDVHGVWLDDEGLPHPWNGAYFAQRLAEECRSRYPADVLASFGVFAEWTREFRASVFTEVVRPSRELFPRARFGNYGDTTSGTASRFSLDALMPALYANTRDLPAAFPGGAPSQAAVDGFYAGRLLRIFSESNSRKSPGKLSIPYVSRFVPDNASSQYRLGMSQRAYRELLRHVWLRGADALFLFNHGFPTKPQIVTHEASFASVEDARAVYDELLAHRLFLERGTPASFAVPKDLSRDALWSGLRVGEVCLVRATPPAGAAATVRVAAFDGAGVDLDVPAEGAYYLLSRDGKAQRL
jgi:hypothetical protein